MEMKTYCGELVPSHGEIGIDCGPGRDHMGDLIMYDASSSSIKQKNCGCEREISTTMVPMNKCWLKRCTDRYIFHAQFKKLRAICGLSLQNNDNALH